MADMDVWHPNDVRVPPPLPPVPGIVRRPLWVRYALYRVSCRRTALRAVWFAAALVGLSIEFAIVRPQRMNTLAALLTGSVATHALLLYRAIRWVDRHDGWGYLKTISKDPTT